MIEVLLCFWIVNSVPIRCVTQTINALDIENLSVDPCEDKIVCVVNCNEYVRGCPKKNEQKKVGKAYILACVCRFYSSKDSFWIKDLLKEAVSEAQKSLHLRDLRLNRNKFSNYVILSKKLNKSPENAY
eukprot:gene12237-5823_t